MSYDLFVWYGPAAASSDEASEFSEEGYEGLEPSPHVAAFLAELFGEFPPLSDDSSDDHVWSFTDDNSDAHSLLSIQFEHAQRVGQRVLELSAKHGLRLFDPQTGDLYPRAAAAAGDGKIIGSSETPTDLIWLIFSMFRYDQDISPHFIPKSAVALGEALRGKRDGEDLDDMLDLLFVATCDGEDLDSTIAEEIDGDRAVVTIVRKRHPDTQRRIHMRCVNGAWKIEFPSVS